MTSNINQHMPMRPGHGLLTTVPDLDMPARDRTGFPLAAQIRCVQKSVVY